MRSLLLVTLLAAACLSLAVGELFSSPSSEQELFVYQRKIYHTLRLLETECPEYSRRKRQLSEESKLPVHIEVAKEVYDELVEALVECREMNSRLTTTTTTPVSRDCQQLYEQGERNNGVYKIDIPNSGLEPFKVWCYFMDSHGWTTFQKRLDGSVDFFRNWTDYEEGFGQPDSEYWLGNERLHALTATNQKLNIYVKAANGSSKTGTWQKFYISDESDKYRLTLNNSGYTGDLDKYRLDYHNGMMFSTKDQDNDVVSDNCAVRYTGAWWYNACYSSNLNGVYNKNAAGGVVWNGFSISLVETTMRVTRD